MGVTCIVTRKYVMHENNKMNQKHATFVITNNKALLIVLVLGGK